MPNEKDNKGRCKSHEYDTWLLYEKLIAACCDKDVDKVCAIQMLLYYKNLAPYIKALFDQSLLCIASTFYNDLIVMENYG